MKFSNQQCLFPKEKINADSLYVCCILKKMQKRSRWSPTREHDGTCVSSILHIHMCPLSSALVKAIVLMMLPSSLSVVQKQTEAVGKDKWLIVLCLQSLKSGHCCTELQWFMTEQATTIIIRLSTWSKKGLSQSSKCERDFIVQWNGPGCCELVEG